jgi:hypothetical protein
MSVETKKFRNLKRSVLITHDKYNKQLAKD